MLWLPGIFSLPALDRDESRFAQSSRQMLDSGNFVDIRFGQVPRYKKPVGIYWAQAAATAVAGHIQNIEGDHSHIWTYRLPSLIGGIAAAWLTYWVGAAFGAEVGFVAALLMGFSVLLTAEASIATTDAVLLAAILGVQGVLMRVYRAAREGGQVSIRTVLWGWASFAIAVLVKGPVVVGVAGATIAILLAWDFWDRRRAKPAEANGAPAPEQNIFRWLKDTRPLLGLPLVLVIVAPWLIAIGFESQGAFFQQSLGHDFAAKLVSGQESHGAPPGYYILLSAVAFWPGILFLLPAIGMAVTRTKEPATRFLLAWAAGFWLICEIVPTKLPQYVLPAYPALAVLTGLWLLSEPAKNAPQLAAGAALYFGGAIRDRACGALRGADPAAAALWRWPRHQPYRVCGGGGSDRAGRADHGGDRSKADRAGAGLSVAVHPGSNPYSGRRPAPHPILAGRQAGGAGQAGFPARRSAAGGGGLSGAQSGLRAQRQSQSHRLGAPPPRRAPIWAAWRWWMTANSPPFSPGWRNCNPTPPRSPRSRASTIRAARKSPSPSIARANWSMPGRRRT